MVHTIEEAAIVMVRFRGYDTHAVVSQPKFLVINGRTFLSGDVPKDAFPGFDGQQPGEEQRLERGAKFSPQRRRRLFNPMNRVTTNGTADYRRIIAVDEKGARRTISTLC